MLKRFLSPAPYDSDWLGRALSVRFLQAPSNDASRSDTVHTAGSTALQSTLLASPLPCLGLGNFRGWQDRMKRATAPMICIPNHGPDVLSKHLALSYQSLLVFIFSPGSPVSRNHTQAFIYEVVSQAAPRYREALACFIASPISTERHR